MRIEPHLGPIKFKKNPIFFIHWEALIRPNFVAGVDQYFAVLYSLEYNAKITSGMSLKLIFSVWTIGFCAAAVSSSQLISAGTEGYNKEWWR